MLTKCFSQKFTHNNNNRLYFLIVKVELMSSLSQFSLVFISSVGTDNGFVTDVPHTRIYYTLLYMRVYKSAITVSVHFYFSRQIVCWRRAADYGIFASLTEEQMVWTVVVASGAAASSSKEEEDIFLITKMPGTFDDLTGATALSPTGGDHDSTRVTIQLFFYFMYRECHS